jgi:hypothetical protein
MHREMSSVSASDLEKIVEQLGYHPTNLIDVSSRKIPEGTPQALRLYPLRDTKRGREPFPTMYWLCCPTLKVRISALEDAGWIKKLQERLLTDPVSLDLFEGQHKAYSVERRALLSSEDAQFLTDREWDATLHSVGVAGIKEYKSIKCLHTHYAHYLSTSDNVVGEWTHHLLSLPPSSN